MARSASIALSDVFAFANARTSSSDGPVSWCGLLSYSSVGRIVFEASLVNACQWIAYADEKSSLCLDMSTSDPGSNAPRFVFPMAPVMVSSAGPEAREAGTTCAPAGTLARASIDPTKLRLFMYGPCAGCAAPHHGTAQRTNA